MVGFVLTVIVQVTPPTQVAPSNIAVSLEPGTDAPGAPPVVVLHIAVEALSQVQAAVQMAKRLAATAGSRSPIRSNKLIRIRFIAAPTSLCRPAGQLLK